MDTCTKGGHPKTPENWVKRSDGKYYCRVCKNIARNARRAVKGRQEDRAAEAAAARAAYAKLKMTTLAVYGGKCACCGEGHPAFLCVDHVNGGGNQHRKTIGNVLYRWLAKNGYPEGFRVLCWNCNNGRDVNGGVCPHEEAR